MDNSPFLISKIGACIIVLILAVLMIKLFIEGNTIEYVKNDWKDVLPYRIRHNRYRGASRPAYALLCLMYYAIKSFLILYFYFAFRFFKFVFWDFWKWIFKFKEREWYQKLYNKLHPDEFDYEDDENDFANDEGLLCDTVISVDNMDGTEFEYFCANLLRINGYTNVRVTSGSGDQGVDILAEKENMVWGFQCKRWGLETHVGNDVVLKTVGSKSLYRCDIAVILTTTTFTRQAEAAAQQTGVLLWGRDRLYKLMEKMNNTAQSGE